MNGVVTGWVLAVALLCMKTINGLVFVPKLVITNDGPTILGAKSTFTATLTFVNQNGEEKSPMDKSKGSEPKYEYVWVQHVCGEYREITVYQDQTCNISQVYTCPEDVGWHKVSLTVKKNAFIIHPEVVRNSTALQVTENINAKLTVNDGVSCNSTLGQSECDVVATNTSVGMGVSIHDPSHFFQGATVLYHWMFGDGSSDTQINQPAVSHIYKLPGRYGITVNMTAIFPDGATGKMTSSSRTGNLKHQLQTMDAIKTLNISGKTDLVAGTKASYNISCQASLPVHLCWYVIPTTTSTLVTTTRPSDTPYCNATTLTDRTWLVVDRWFNKSGGYIIGVYASNAISHSASHKAVRAEGDNTSGTVTGLTIGILFGIAGCALSVGVVTTYMRRRNRRHVEVANFDFQGRSRHQSTLATKIWRFLQGRGNGERTPLSKDFIKNRTV